MATLSTNCKFDLYDPFVSPPQENQENAVADNDLIHSIKGDPLRMFKEWLEMAKRHSHIVEPGAFTLATVDANGYPSGRIMLLKGITDNGFLFFTNYESDKVRELEKVCRNKCGMSFYWGPLERQIRIRGTIRRLSDVESDRYFATRDRDSQLGAWASKQSRLLDHPIDLVERFEEAKRRFADYKNVPRPPHWGGFEVIADTIEFWQSRPYRLHSRLQCIRRSEQEIEDDLAASPMSTQSGGETGIPLITSSGFKHFMGGKWKFCRLFP